MIPKYITPQIVHHQPENIPADLHPWQDENSGISALTQAAADIAKGKKVNFAIGHRLEDGRTVVVIDEIVTFAMGEGGNPKDGYQPLAPRYCGEDNDPNGAGSHALIPSWYDYCADPAHIAVALARAFSGKLYFRVR